MEDMAKCFLLNEKFHILIQSYVSRGPIYNIWSNDASPSFIDTYMRRPASLNYRKGNI